MSSPEGDLALLRALAQAGGAVAMSYFRRDPKSWEKAEGAGPVTEADLAVDALIKTRIAAERPDWGWLSEETPDDRARLERDLVLILDPIDGTRSFAKGEHGWCVALALAARGEVVAAAAQFPSMDRLYTARRGGGAHLNGAPLSASLREILPGAQVVAGRGQLDAKRWPGGAPPVDQVFRHGLVHRLCMAAEGAADAALTTGRAWEWDVAAGALLAQEAGCAVTDIDGAPARFNQPDPRLNGVLVAPPPLHEALLTLRAPAQTA